MEGEGCRCCCRCRRRYEPRKEKPGHERIAFPPSPLLSQQQQDRLADVAVGACFEDDIILWDMYTLGFFFDCPQMDSYF